MEQDCIWNACLQVYHISFSHPNTLNLPLYCSIQSKTASAWLFQRWIHGNLLIFVHKIASIFNNKNKLFYYTRVNLIISRKSWEHHIWLIYFPANDSLVVSKEIQTRHLHYLNFILGHNCNFEQTTKSWRGWREYTAADMATSEPCGPWCTGCSVVLPPTIMLYRQNRCLEKSSLETWHPQHHFFQNLKLSNEQCYLLMWSYSQT